MIVGGVDIGSSSTKAVILEDGKIIATGIFPTKTGSIEELSRFFENTLCKIHLSTKDLAYTVSTGYGRRNVPFAQKTITEISCHARGVVSIFPDVRTVLDMGGQDCKAIRCDEKGNVHNFIMNDKCAAGTGRYIERMAKILNVELQDIGRLSLDYIQGPAPISNYCAVFAQWDVVSLLRQGRHVNDILAGLCESLTERVEDLIKKLGLVDNLSVSGGIAKNLGIVTRLERNLGRKISVAPEPQIIGAMGAALFAQGFARSR